MRIGVASLGNVSGDTGGRNYIEHFFRTLPELDTPHEFVLFLSEGERAKLDLGSAQITIVELPPRPNSPLHKIIGEQFLLPRAIRRTKIDVMYFPGNFASYHTPVPYVLSIRALAHYYGANYGVDRTRRIIRKGLMPFSARRAKKIIAPSHDIKNDILKFIGIETDQIEVVPHGVDTSLFDGERNRRAPEGFQLLGHYGLQPQQYLLYVSALWRYKNQDKLIEAHARIIRQLQASKSDLPMLVIAGKGTGNDPQYLQYLHTLPAKLGTTDFVRFTGQLSQLDLRYLYAHARAFVFPSSYESFGNPLFESWASGIPVAASNVHSFPEIVGDAGLLFDPLDENAFDRTLLQLLTDHPLRESLVAKGLERVRLFSWKRAVERTISVLEHVKTSDSVIRVRP